jgi:hypothetical protein
MLYVEKYISIRIETIYWIQHQDDVHTFLPYPHSSAIVFTSLVVEIQQTKHATHCQRCH